MSYTPPLSENTIKIGFKKFLCLFLYSFVPIIITVIAVWRYNNNYASISAILGLFSSVFTLTSSSYLNPKNQLVDVTNYPQVKKYFTYSIIINSIPIVLSILFLILDFIK